MKKFFACLSFLLCAGAFALPASYYSLDLDEAKANAKKENKLVLVVFSKCDSCSRSRNFDKDYLRSSKFKSFAKKNLIIVNIDVDKDRKISVKEKVEAQEKARRIFAGRYRYYPGVFIVNPEDSSDYFISDPLSFKINDFIKEIKYYKKSLGKDKK